ncbi:MAG: hypothetical protein WAX16_07895 [Lactococcus raffinolactis]
MSGSADPNTKKGKTKEHQLSGRKTVIGTSGSAEPEVNKETNVKLAELAMI